jgi:hypothetical protein
MAARREGVRAEREAELAPIRAANERAAEHKRARQRRDAALRWLAILVVPPGLAFLLSRIFLESEMLRSVIPLAVTGAVLNYARQYWRIYGRGEAKNALFRGDEPGLGILVGVSSSAVSLAPSSASPPRRSA